MHPVTPPITRRTVVRGSAWGVPVLAVAVAAPAYAASGGCGTTSLIPSVESGDQAHQVKLVRTDTYVKVADIIYSATRGGVAVDPFSGRGNMTGYRYATAGDVWDGIRLHHQQGMSQGDLRTMTVTFLQPVSGLTLTISDIDKDVGEWIDEVIVTPAGFGFVKPAGGIVTGVGTSANPFTTDYDAGIDDHSGDVTLTWPGPASEVTITYRAADASNESGIGQHIDIGRFGYSAC